MSSTRADLTVSPFYHQAKNEIVQPGHFVACSRYFVQHWIPLLGGTAVSLILQLRSLGYYNPHTGELRDGVRIGIKRLAELCGCSDRTIQRELENNKWLRCFVRVESSYEQLPDGRVRHHENIYRIAMDDPLIPEHEPRLEAIVAEREREWKTSDRGREQQAASSKRQAASGSNNPVHSIGPTGPIRQTEPVPDPMNDNLSPPSTDRGRQSVTRVASKCRFKDSQNIPVKNIPSDIRNNNTPTPGAASSEGETGVVVADSRADSGSGSPELLETLRRSGVSHRVAREIITAFPESEIRRQIDALPYRDAKDGAAMLVKAIREGWALPPALIEAQERAEREREEKESARQRREDAARKEAMRSEVLARLEAYWRGLPAGEQARIDAEAKDTVRRANPIVARYLEKATVGPIVRASVEAARQQILRDRLGI